MSLSVNIYCDKLIPSIKISAMNTFFLMSLRQINGNRDIQIIFLATSDNAKRLRMSLKTEPPLIVANKNCAKESRKIRGKTQKLTPKH